MNEDIKSLKDIEVWDLVLRLEVAKTISCTKIFKDKRDSKVIRKFTTLVLFLEDLLKETTLTIERRLL